MSKICTVAKKNLHLTLSIADGGEIEFLPPGQPLLGFDLKMKVKNKKPNRKSPAGTKAKK